MNIKIISIFSLSLLFFSCGKSLLPPRCELLAQPREGTLYTNFLFRASGIEDSNNPGYALKFRIDFNGDSLWDTDFDYTREWAYRYSKEGQYNVSIQIIDPDNNTAISTTQVVVTNENQNPLGYLFLSLLITSTTSTVDLDGSYSWDYEESNDLLSYRWDLNGDGLWDTEFSTNPVYSTVFSLPGILSVGMEVRDSEGTSDIVTDEIEVINTINPYGKLLDTRDGVQYPTVKIGNRWWMAANLRYGNHINSSSSPSNNNLVEYFAFNDKPENIAKYGALYFWGEAMNYSQSEASRGICPDGWHIPTDNEWNELEHFLGMNDSVDLENSWLRGSSIGELFRKGGGSGFEAGMFGYIGSNRIHTGLQFTVGYWTSSLEQGDVYTRFFSTTESGIYKSKRSNINALFIRCIQNEE